MNGDEKMRIPHDRKGIKFPPNFERIDGCPKRAYKRRRDARTAARGSQLTLYIYRCPKCGMHHLTSRRGTNGR